MKLDEFVKEVLLSVNSSIDEINEKCPQHEDGHINYPVKVEFSMFVSPDLDVTYEGWSNLRFTIERTQDGIWEFK